MLTYTGRRNLYGDLTGNSSTTNLTLGDKLMNMFSRELLASSAGLDFAQKTATDTTVANQQFYELPYNHQELENSTITVGTIVYTPRRSPSRDHWDQLNQASNIRSNIPQWYFIWNGEIGYYPTPSSSSNTITHHFAQKAKDLSIADYTTGTVSAVTNGAKTVTGSGTTWTTAMAGRAILFDEASGGDGYWYEIASVASATSLTLTRKYAGTTVAAGSVTYTIGQIAAEPEEFQMIPVYKAAYFFFTTISPDATKAQLMKGYYDEAMKRLEESAGSKFISPAIDDGTIVDWQNPNLYLTL